MSDALLTKLNKIKNEKDSHLLPENVKKDVTILGVTGTLEGGIDTSDATATASDILKDKTAYVDGEKLTGTLDVGEYNVIVKNPIYGGSEYGSGINNCIKKVTDVVLGSTSYTSAGYSAFRRCENLEEVSFADTSKIQEMSYMFSGCSNLNKITGLNTSNVTSMSSMFNSCKSLTSIPEINTSKVTRMDSMFSGCTSLTSIPEIDTSLVERTTNMFDGCTNLTTIPTLNLKNLSASYMSNMFRNCSSLSDDSLNNILASCITAVKVTYNKTLKTLGLTSTQATTCQGLSNYQAFLDAGWTTGY